MSSCKWLAVSLLVISSSRPCHEPSNFIVYCECTKSLMRSAIGSSREGVDLGIEEVLPIVLTLIRVLREALEHVFQALKEACSAAHGALGRFRLWGKPDVWA